MTDDLLKRLRHCSKNCGDEYLHELTGRSADRIEALTAENERLRVQLADLANTINIVGSHYHKAQVALDDLVLDVKKRARAALGDTQ